MKLYIWVAMTYYRMFPAASFPSGHRVLHHQEIRSHYCIIDVFVKGFQYVGILEYKLRL